MTKLESLNRYNWLWQIVLFLLLPLLSAHIMVVKGERYSLVEFLQMPEYYIALSASFIIAACLLLSVIGISRLLDKRLPWKEAQWTRLCWQVLLGVLGISILAYGLAAVYFRFRGISIEDTDYLSHDFLPVIEFIMLINFFYFARFAYLSFLIPLWRRVERSYDQTSVASRRHFRWKQKNLSANKVVLYNLEGQHVFSFTRKGDRNIEEGSLKRIQEGLDEKEYFRVNKRTIIHRSLVLFVDKVNGSRLLRLSLDHPELDTTLVSQARVKDFKVWFRER